MFAFTRYLEGSFVEFQLSIPCSLSCLVVIILFSVVPTIEDCVASYLPNCLILLPVLYFFCHSLEMCRTLLDLSSGSSV